MTQKERSLVSKNSNSLNAMIKKTSMTFTNNNFKKIAFVATAIVMLSVVGTFGFSDNIVAFAKKPQAVIDWSNGFPSGEHSTMNIHGKKAEYNCDNSLEGTELYGNSVFVQMYGPSEINIVSNKRSDLTQGKAIDPCADPFGSHSVDPALYQLPEGEHQVYWRILGKPGNGNGGTEPSEARITSPMLLDQCNFLPTAFADGSIVQWFDPDAQANAEAGLNLKAFNGNEMYVESGDFAGFDSLDSIYRDNLFIPTGFVDAGDDHLYGPMVVTDNTVPLLTFDPNVKHEDTGATPDAFDQGETVYYSMDNFVSQDDIRLANAASQGLGEFEGGDAIDCSDQTLVGLGLINNNGAFDKTEYGLERFEDPEPVKGKGKSKAIEVTELFEWTGAICDAAILDTWDTDGTPGLSISDFETVLDGIITAAELKTVLLLPLLTDAEDLIAEVELAVSNDPDAESGDTNSDGIINTEAEFAYFLKIQFGDEFNCEAFLHEWVFNIADIVLYGFDYENNGTTLSQMRFYPTATTEFVE